MQSKNTTSYADRFWARVRFSDGCWEWTGARKRSGYGWVAYQGKQKSASRVAWILTNGPIPEDLFVLHRCDNPPCCRPDHLFLGTNNDNMKDMAAKGRWRGWSHEGEACPTHILTAQEVLTLRAKRQAGTLHLLPESIRLGVAEATISNAVTGKTWRHVVSPPVPVTPRDKLTADIVRDLRARYHAGERSVAVWAQQYGVAQSTLRQALRGGTWRRVDG